MVFLYLFLVLFTGNLFSLFKLLIYIFLLLLINLNKILSAKAFDQRQWTTGHILEKFNVSEIYKNKSLLKRMQNSGNRTHVFYVFIL